MLALTAFALAVRLWGIGFRLPHASLGDERFFAGFVALMTSGEQDPELGYYFGFYPQLVPRIALALRGVPATPSTLAGHLARAGSDVLLLRVVTACLSVLIVPATYRIARRFLARGASLLAAGLAGASFLGVWYSAQARPHGAFAALATVALYAALEARRRGDLASWTLAGAAAALAVGALQSAAFLAGALGLAVLGAPPARTWRQRLVPLVSLAPIAVALRAFYPFAFAEQRPAGARPEDFEGHDWNPVQDLLPSLDGSGFAKAAGAAWRYDPLISAAAAIALLALAAGALRGRVRLPRGARAWDLAVIGGYALPFALVLGLYASTYQRYLQPFVPLAAVLAAAGLARVARGRAFAALALALCAAQSALALRLAALRARPDTAEQAAAWIESHVDRPGERIALLPGLELPLLRGAESNAWLAPFAPVAQHPWTTYQAWLDPGERARLGWRIVTPPAPTHEERERIQADPGPWVDALDARWAVIEVHEPARTPLFARLREGLVARGTLAARFSPWADARDDRPFVPNDLEEPHLLRGSFVGHALRARALGPVIEIYRLGR